MRASALMSSEETARVEAAMVAAELRTSGEIVVCVASRSGRYERGEGLCGLIFALIAVGVLWTLMQRVDESGWGRHVALGLVPVLLAFALGFFAGAAAAARMPALALLFTPRAQMREAVVERAALEFQKLGVRRTRAATGVLIYVSLLERMVWVVGDEAVAAKIPAERWNEMRDLLVEGLRQDAPAEGIARAVDLAGELLGGILPRPADDVDELPTKVHFVD
jgi:putative membrane protein